MPKTRHHKHAGLATGSKKVKLSKVGLNDFPRAPNQKKKVKKK
jgi:hypothetical protein